MKRRTHIASIILFTFLLVLPWPILGHDDEHQAKGGHGSSELYEEGSGMKVQSEKHGEYEEHRQSSEYMEEGSGMKVHSKKHGEDKENVTNKEHGEYDKHGESSEHVEEGSGMR